MQLSKRKKQEDFLMECSNAKIQIAVKSTTEVLEVDGFVRYIAEDIIMVLLRLKLQ